MVLFPLFSLGLALWVDSAERPRPLSPLPRDGRRGRLPNDVWRDALFNEVASAQRGRPERAMLRLQHAQIAQLYGWVAEHVGDLTHRMTENFSWFEGGYNNTGNKVDKTLRELRKPNFERYVRDQVRSNLRYHQERGESWYPDEAAAWAELVRLGKAYADAHRKIPVFNVAQVTARTAAVRLGEMDFAGAQLELGTLARWLDEGEEAWAHRAGQIHPKIMALSTDLLRARLWERRVQGALTAIEAGDLLVAREQLREGLRQAPFEVNRQSALRALSLLGSGTPRPEILDQVRGLLIPIVRDSAAIP